MSDHKPKVVSLFTGVGGLDFGFEAGGFETVLAIESDPTVVKTVKKNRPHWTILEGDVNDFSMDVILSRSKLIPREADVLIAGPPCQPFSKSGYWKKGDSARLDDPRADTLTGFLRILRYLQPKTFLLENVYGLVYKDKDEGLTYLFEEIKQINYDTGSNYSVFWKKLNAVHYGVPQKRERVFLVGSREGRTFQFPAATHADIGKSDLDDQVEPARTAWDAIGDLPEPTRYHDLQVTGWWADLLPTIPEGKNYLWHTRKGGGWRLFGWRTRYWSYLLKLSKELPSWTIQAQPGACIGPFHWKNRKLSVEEMSRLQTFPDGIEFNCGQTDAQKMLGNAVPSLMAEILAREIATQLLDRSFRTKYPELLPPVRRPIPEPEPVGELPAKFWHLIGDHPDHPGEGVKRQAVNSKVPKVS